MPGCTECFFGGKTVGYKGDVMSPFVIVGESPGALELADGKPFVGPSGDLLNECLEMYLPILKQFNIEPFITNAIGCLPRQKDPAKLALACQRCNSRLVQELQMAPRKVILALGNGALWATTGQYNLKITQVRGTVFESALAEHGIIAAVHPSFLLRGGGNLQQFKRDIGLAVELLTGVKTEKAASTGKITTAGSFTPGKWEILDTEAKVKALAKKLASGKILAAAGDTETDGFNPRQRIINEPSFKGEGLLSLGICYEVGISYVIPGPLVNDSLFDNEIEWAWHNGKYDISWLREYGCEHARVDDDTMLMSYLMNEKGGIHDLEQVGNDWLKAPNYKGMLEKYLPTKKHSYAYIPKDVLYQYQGIDTELTFALRNVLKPRIMADPRLRRVYNEILIPGSEFIHRIEKRGFYVDVPKVLANEERLGGIADKWEKEFIDLATGVDPRFKEINIRSPKQVSDLIYNTMKLGPIGWSTDFDTLEKLPKHPVVQAIQEYRGVHKQVSTFVTPVRLKRDVDGRIHTTFKLHGTTTGRLSSNKPNMQNIPRDKDIRGQFIAAPGRCLLEVDLAQAELRMLACLSRDTAMINIFNSGISLHDEVAEFLFGKGFNKEQKMIAKNINFGIVYGISPHGLREQVEIGAKLLGSHIHVTIQDAAKWIDGWAKRFPEAWAFIQKCRAAPAKGQTLISAFGRKRRFGVVGFERLNNLQNEAANFPHQSGAHDITLISGTELAAEFELDYDTFVVNEVHDALVHDCPDDMAVLTQVAARAIETLEATPKKWGLTVVPFKAEAELGYAWGNGKGFNPFDYIDKIDKLQGVTYEAFKQSESAI